jgi:protocatechuate 3,4-dioxygenase beta subunit
MNRLPDDVQHSRARISRRRALSLSGTIGLTGLLAACSGDSGSGGSRPAGARSQGAPASADVIAALNRTPTCALAKEETPGPYWFDVDSVRSDIRDGRPGTPFHLSMRVQDMGRCAPSGEPAVITRAVIEIWHCDAGGVYSGFESGSRGGGPGGAAGGTSDGSYSAGDKEAKTTDDGTFLRGAQAVDGSGIAQFRTIFPGWYRGRTTHIHVKVHIDRKTVLTTQLFVDDAVADEIYRKSPYSSHAGRDTRNADDSIYDASGRMTIEQQGSGYTGAINLGVKL